MRKFFLIIFIAVALTAGYYVLTNTEKDTTPVPPKPTSITQDNNGTLKIAAFNIQIFGKAKSSNADVMLVLSEIARKFDLMTVE